MMPYKRRYTLLMRLQDHAGLLIQAALLVFLIIAAYATYKPRSRPDMALNAAVDSCQARGYFDAGTVRVKCQVEGYLVELGILQKGQTLNAQETPPSADATEQQPAFEY